METQTAEAYGTMPPLGASGRAAVLRALDRVGVYARVEPFPEMATVPCDRRTGCTLHTDAGVAVPSPTGGTHFEVLRPTAAHRQGAVRGPYSGSGRCYALVQKIKKAIYGSVMLAQVVRVEQQSLRQ